MLFDIHLVISLRLKVVFSDTYKLANRSETKDWLRGQCGMTGNSEISGADAYVGFRSRIVKRVNSCLDIVPICPLC